MQKISRALLPVLVTLFTLLPAYSQSERGTIVGSVKDSSGAVVPDAKVTVVNIANNSTVSISSSQSGDFTAVSLSVGTYTVRVEAKGFRPAIVNGLVLNAASSVRADVTLEVGSTGTAVEIQAGALQLSTDSAKTSSNVTNKMVDELPLVVGGTMRSPFDLAATTPEAKQLGGDQGFVLGGGQAASYGTNLDGVSANTTRALQQSWVATNAPSLEALTEFSVDTNGFKAEYGHAGGGVMNFVSKSGTNQFHGSGYEFLRNNALDSNNWFNNRAGIDKPVYKQNDFGASFGGPIVIPKIYNGKDKTFFFYNREQYREFFVVNDTAITVPTAAYRAGNFAAAQTGRNLGNDPLGRAIIEGTIFDPATARNVNGQVIRDAFTNNTIPTARLDKVALAIQNLVPLPGNGATALNLIPAFANDRVTTNESVKIEIGRAHV